MEGIANGDSQIIAKFIAYIPSACSDIAGNGSSNFRRSCCREKRDYMVIRVVAHRIGNLFPIDPAGCLLNNAAPGTFARGIGDDLLVVQHNSKLDYAEGYDEQQRCDQSKLNQGRALLALVLAHPTKAVIC